MITCHFNDPDGRAFLTLQVGYGLYAVRVTRCCSGCIYIIRGRCGCPNSVAGTSVFTVFSLFFPKVYYGFGFQYAGSFSSGCDQAGCVYQKTLHYILSVQPVGSRG